MPDHAPLILASASPRRADLLARLHVAFTVAPCDLPEPAEKPPATPPAHWALALAYFKARSVADRHPHAFILGADTIVTCANQLLGKPRDRADAHRMLTLQAGRRSDVITGVALLAPTGATRTLFADRTAVWMRRDDAALARYLDSGDWAGKAGAYGIQDTATDPLIERIAGSFDNVVGLPTERLTPFLAPFRIRESG